MKRIVAAVLALLLVGSVTWGSETEKRTRVEPTPWVAYATINMIGVTADAVTTQQALNRGARELNPLYSHLGNDGIAPARFTLGVVETYALTKLHKRYPKTAKGIAIFGFVSGVALAIHNDRVCRPECE